MLGEIARKPRIGGEILTPDGSSGQCSSSLSSSSNKLLIRKPLMLWNRNHHLHPAKWPTSCAAASNGWSCDATLYSRAALIACFTGNAATSIDSGRRHSSHSDADIGHGRNGTDEFDEDFLREQQVKLLQIHASRAVLSSQHILRLMLTSPVPMSIGHSATSRPAPTSPSRTPHTDKSDVDAYSDVVDGSANESALVNPEKYELTMSF